MHPKTEGILESSLYVADVAQSVHFYERIFGFQAISDFEGQGCAMQAGDRQILLLFKKGGARGIESPHDGAGELHLAFAIPAAELASWEAWLAENGIAVEEKEDVGARRPEPLFSRSRLASHRGGYAGRLADLLTRPRLPSAGCRREPQFVGPGGSQERRA